MDVVYLVFVIILCSIIAVDALCFIAWLFTDEPKHITLMVYSGFPVMAMAIATVVMEVVKYCIS